MHNELKYRQHAVNYELRDTSFKLRETSYKLQDTRYELRYEITKNVYGPTGDSMVPYLDGSVMVSCRTTYIVHWQDSAALADNYKPPAPADDCTYDIGSGGKVTVTSLLIYVTSYFL